MNLLSIQDTLKNASDQQLAHLMQSPDSTAPSYLVLSELRRRKEMRSKQVEKPRGTVAEDLTKDERTYADQEGIRSLRVPGYEDEAQAAERNPDEGIEAMREGGIVRMQAGGRSLAQPGSFYGTSMSDLERQGIDEDYERSMGGIETNFLNRQVQSGRAVDDTTQAIADIRARISSGTAPERAIAEALPGYRNVDAASLRQLFGVNAPTAAPASPAPAPATATAPPSSTTARPEVQVGPAASAPPASSFASDPSLLNPNAPPRAFDRPAANAPGGSQGGSQSGPQGGPGGTRIGGGGGGGGGAAAPAGASIRALTPDGEAPNMQTIMERNLGLIPGMPQELLDRIRSSRTNESERRREAQNMAMIEAGLRIASSNNPRLAGAIGEGAAPAVQAYGQQLSQIRQDQRADLQTEMATAQFDLQRRYAAGQISATEYRTALTELGAYRRSAMQIAAENARSNASLGSASADRALARQAAAEARIGEGKATPAQIAAMSPEHRQIYREQQTARNPRNADVGGLSSLAHTLSTRMDRDREALAIDMADRRPMTPERQRARTELESRLERTTKAYNDAIDSLTAPRGSGVGTGGGAQYQYTPNGVVPSR